MQEVLQYSMCLSSSFRAEMVCTPARAAPEDTGRLGQSRWEGVLVADSGSGHKNISLEPLQSLTHIATATWKRVFKMSKKKKPQGRSSASLARCVLSPQER